MMVKFSHFSAADNVLVPLTLYVTVLHICNKHKKFNSVFVKFCRFLFHLEVAETICKMNTKSKGEVEEGIEGKNIKGLLSICHQTKGP